MDTDKMDQQQITTEHNKARNGHIIGISMIQRKTTVTPVAPFTNMV